ncbi:MAG: aminotransferase class III-fold pyridoxal phosphate-dependent enzyme [Alphaproteobacteria bacterium]
MDARKPDITRSNALWHRAERIIPMGTQTYSKRPNQFVDGLTPKYLERGRGCLTWDVDGNEYIDYVMACQPVILGYCDPDVDAAIIEQLRNGIVFSLATPLEVEVAERLIDIIPCAEGVRFGKNGADATSAAVRVARAVTEREHVAYCGYHGWHDWYIANTDRNAGIPRFNQDLTHAFSYNDLDSLAQVFERHKNQIACVIMEPLQVAEPKDNFLHKVRDLAHANGALLVFDEIITGFRFAEGGAQQLIGVTPDLACFAKAMSNGMPVSAVVGKHEYIQALENTFFSFTYGGETLSLAAARATIDKIRREKVIDHLWTVGGRLKEGFNALAARHGVEDFVQCLGYPCRTVVSFDGRGRFDSLEIKTLFQQETIKRGVLFGGYHSMSFSHTADIVDRTLEVYDDTMKVLRSIIDQNKPITDFLEGPVVQPVFRKVNDFMAQTTRR